MKYFSAFSGYGGFELGIQQAYVDVSSAERREQGRVDMEEERPLPEQEPLVAQQPHCIGFSEIDRYAIQTYSKHFPTHKNYGSITDIDASTLPDFDLFVGGFPCQAFSIAGKRKGFEDTRGTLIYDVFRIIKEKHPRFVVLENVKGLLSHDGGSTFKTIITSLAELGYAVEWQVLNAKNFGVPQNRERVFIVGHLGGFGGRQIFPIGEGDRKDFEPDGRGSAEVFPTIRATHFKSGDNQPLIKQLNNPTHSNNRLYGEEGISPALNTAQGGNRQPKIPSESRIRRLTPTECERLMGLPDGWTEGVSDTQRYKLCGNGVVVNVVEEIMKRLFEFNN